MYTTMTIVENLHLNKKPTLGEALAILQAEDQYNLQREAYDAHINGYLDSLRARSMELSGDTSFFELLEKFIRVHCRGQNADVEECRDFFIYLFLVKNNQADCLELARRLNQSFHCFETFSRVLRDYSRTFEDLSSGKDGTEK